MQVDMSASNSTPNVNEASNDPTMSTPNNNNKSLQNLNNNDAGIDIDIDTNANLKAKNTTENGWSLSFSFRKLFRKPSINAELSSSSIEKVDFSSIAPSRASQPQKNMLSVGACKRLTAIHEIYNYLRDTFTGVELTTFKHPIRGNIPNAFSGDSLLKWFGVEDNQSALKTDAETLCRLLFFMGFIISLDGNSEFVESSFMYVFQLPCLLPSANFQPLVTDYARYLCRRKKLHSTDYSLENHERIAYEKLRLKYESEWESIEIAADKDLAFLESIKKKHAQLYQIQEKVFWNVYRPSNDSRYQFLDQEARILKKARVSPQTYENSLDDPHLLLYLEQNLKKIKETKNNPKISCKEASVRLIDFCSALEIIDPLLCRKPSNPWISEDESLWNTERIISDIDLRIWKSSFRQLMRDNAGIEYFRIFLKKEFSEENLLFVIDIRNLDKSPTAIDFTKLARIIYTTYIQPGAPSEINISSQTTKKLKEIFSTIGQDGCLTYKDYGCFDEAENHILELMEKDSYPRFCKSIIKLNGK